jgi:four helix bundle protein
MADKFENLPLFKDSYNLVLEVYRVTKNFPKIEIYGLTSQIRRSASSVVANIVEGNSRNHKKEHIEFLSIAKGSLEETKFHLMLSKDLGYLTEEEYNYIHELSESVGKQITGLLKYFRRTIS